MSEPLPEHIRNVRNAFVARFPVPRGVPGSDDFLDNGFASHVFEDKARTWTRELAEQIVFSTGDSSWGTKNAGGGRPQSKDAIAHQLTGRLIGYDMLYGVGTGRPTLVDNPSGEDITGQTFIMVSPVDHLNGTKPPTQPPPSSGDSDLDKLRTEVAALRAVVESLKTPVIKKIALKSAHGTYVCADAGHPDNPLMANRAHRQSWETFEVEIIEP